MVCVGMGVGMRKTRGVICDMISKFPSNSKLPLFAGLSQHLFISDRSSGTAVVLKRMGWVSTLPPSRSAMFRDIFGRQLGVGCATGIQWVESKGAANSTSYHAQAASPTTEASRPALSIVQRLRSSGAE